MNTFLLLTSPPASGKTYWIERYFEKVAEKILVISPLKALAVELEEKWQGKISVRTPESYLLSPEEASIVIFDEFHLLFYWGDHFREGMWQAFFEISMNSSLCIGLTATFNDEILSRVKEWHHFDQFLWFDAGNLKLKYEPSQITRFLNQKLHHDFIFLQDPEKTQVIFCEFREEVKTWVEKIREQGFSVLGCVGGETQSFTEKLKGGRPQFIVSTTCLSHGVNLPIIEAVHFTYKVDNLDFWIQMTARGGRDGSAYRVYCSYLLKEVKLNFWTNLWRNFKLMIWIKFHQMILGMDQWFLKASSLEKLPIRKET
ncbi:MAG: helicase-related protein [Bacteriovoracaceae bacterium]